jgi:hypothetical protein
MYLYNWKWHASDLNKYKDAETIEVHMNSGLFDSLPIYFVFLVVAALILLSFEIGYFISKHTNKSSDTGAAGAISPMVIGLLGVLGFVLAFSFAMAAAEHKVRKQNALDDANVIATAYLRTDLVDEAVETKVKQYLKEYVDIRIQGISDIDQRKKHMARSLELHELLWSEAVSLGKSNANRSSILLIQSIDELIIMHERRLVTALNNRIPTSIWMTLFTISSLTMLTMGVHAGISRSRRLIASIPLIVAFAALTTVIVDLDRIHHSFITVNQQAMIDLQKKMH